MASETQPIGQQDRIPGMSAQTPTVLLVNGDANCSNRCFGMLDQLGYRYDHASRAREALDKIAKDSTIQILMTEVESPSCQGMNLIEEARVRIGGRRALATVMYAQNITTEIAVKGLHVGAVDLLSKPLDQEACSNAMRRAMRYLTARRPANDGVDMSLFAQQMSRLMNAFEMQGGVPGAIGEITSKQIRATLQNLIATRGMRTRYFPSDLFADPAWDILLDLTRARLEGQEVSVSSVCIAASVPMSTALRWVRQMTDGGLLRRWTDPKDRRRDLIALTDTTAAHMREYLGAVHAAIQKI